MHNYLILLFFIWGKKYVYPTKKIFDGCIEYGDPDDLVGYLVWFRRLWVRGFSVSNSIVFFLPHLTRWRLLCGRLKKLPMEGTEKKTKIPFEFQLYFWVLYGYSVAKKCLPGPLEKQSRPQARCWNVFVIFGGW